MSDDTYARGGRGKGELHLAWKFDHDSPADYLAVVDLSRDLAWLFTIDEARQLAQQKPAGAKWRLYWYPGDAVVKGNPRREADMVKYQIETAIGRILADYEAGETTKSAKMTAAHQD